MFVTVLDPFHRAAQPFREIGDKNVFRIDMPFDTEATPDIRCDADHPLFRHVERVRDFAPDPVNHLTGRPDGQRIFARIVIGHHPTAFNRHCRIAVMGEPAFQAVRCRFQRLCALTLRGVEDGRDIAAEMFMQQRRTVGQGIFRPGNRRQWIEIGFDQFDRVFGEIAAFRDDQCIGLADEAQLVMGDQRLVGDQDVGIDPVAPPLRRGYLHAADGRQHIADIGPADRKFDTVGGPRGCQIHSPDQRMGKVAAGNRHMQHVGKLHVGDERAFAEKQVFVFPAGNGLSDIARECVSHARPPPSPGPHSRSRR